MKDWQFFTLLATIYAAPHLNERYSMVASILFCLSALAYYVGG